MYREVIRILTAELVRDLWFYLFVYYMLPILRSLTCKTHPVV